MNTWTAQWGMIYPSESRGNRGDTFQVGDGVKATIYCFIPSGSVSPNDIPEAHHDLSALIAYGKGLDGDFQECYPVYE